MQNKPKNDMSSENLTKSEAKIQQEIAMYYRNSFCLKHHKTRCMILSIPNEGRGAASIQLMATGLYPGAGDLFVLHRWMSTESPFDDRPVPEYEKREPMFIECKAEGGVQSDKQKAFQEHCESMGIGYYIVRSLDEFKAVLRNL
jgi:hypothetical protein